MSLPEIMIAIGFVAVAVAAAESWLAIRRLRARLAEAARRLAHDPLTGLLNRTGLLAAHAVSLGAPQPVIVTLIDLDEFKLVNDTHGHDAGDDLLIAVADRINEAAQLFGGVAARLSGDEYAVLQPVRSHELGRIGETFVAMIGQPVELTIDGQPVTITPTASIGLSLAETSDPLEDIILHRADLAMYHAKRRGGNTFTIYEPGMAMPHIRPRKGARLRDLRQQHRGDDA